MRKWTVENNQNIDLKLFVWFQNHCKGVADKYVEFEQITVVIDLALLQTPAYRHVLFNTDFQVLSKGLSWPVSLLSLFLPGNACLFVEILEVLDNPYLYRGLLVVEQCIHWHRWPRVLQWRRERVLRQLPEHPVATLPVLHAALWIHAGAWPTMYRAAVVESNDPVQLLQAPLYSRDDMERELVVGVGDQLYNDHRVLDTVIDLLIVR